MTGVFIFVNEWDAPSVAEQPAVKVRSWRVIEAASGGRHLLAILEHGPVRITSPVVGFDSTTGELKTQSGRSYELIGPPEARQPQLALLNANALRAGVVSFVDVSDSLWQLIGAS